MHVERTKYTAHYENGFVVAQWISVEMAIDGSNSESAFAALDRSKEMVEKWYKKNNIPFESNAMPPGPPSTIVVERTSEDVRIADLIRSMYACTKLDGDDGLWAFRKLAHSSVMTASVYDLIEKKLVANESMELPDSCNEFTEKYKEKLKTDPVLKAIYDLEVDNVAKYTKIK